MTVAPARRRSGEAGFTLIEALVALALTGLVLSALATITAQWLPNWNRGIDRVQRSELVGIAMQRIAADLAAAEYVPANREQHGPLFDGSEFSVTFVRTAFGPNAGIGLDVVRIGETRDGRDLVTTRTRTGFGPLPAGAPPMEQLHFGDPVVLLPPPFRLSFAYAGVDRVWKSNWHSPDKLPTAIMITARDATSGQVLLVPTVATIHVNAPPPSADEGNADNKQQNSKDNAAPNKNPDNGRGGS